MNIRDNTKQLDYRTVDNKFMLEQTAEKKEILEQQIKKLQPKTKILYNVVSDKQNKNNFFEDFANIYHRKCAYCGTSTDIQAIENYEVDHYICESSFINNIQGRIEAGKIENLVLSCRNCNRFKSNLLIKDDYIKLLNPDDNSICNIFYRDDESNIKIKDEFIKDKFINEFYDKLNLANEFRRLDYLILQQQHLLEFLRETKKITNEIELVLLKSIGMLKTRRNNYLPKSKKRNS